MESLTPFSLKPWYAPARLHDYTLLFSQSTTDTALPLSQYPTYPQAVHGMAGLRKDLCNNQHNQCRVLELTAWMMSAVVLQGVGHACVLPYYWACKLMRD